jgi:hypothetical protein
MNKDWLFRWRSKASLLALPLGHKEIMMIAGGFWYMYKEVHGTSNVAQNIDDRLMTDVHLAGSRRDRNGYTHSFQLVVDVSGPEHTIHS